ncbi:glycosyltransferase family 2 protein [Sodalis sp. RH13]|uniref:glycosyltransferase family 2 protein n=1 Tax=Sodalis sp. RH13 TaxID=3394328 RepID=UPI0039B4E2E1
MKIDKLICPISVIIPAYNVASYIVDAVDSIMRQNILPAEIIIVNDGSTDNTLDILLKNYANEQRINILNIANNGVGNARNIAIAKSSQPFIFCCDPDDIVKDGFFEEFSLRLAQNNDMELFCFSSERFLEGTSIKLKKVNHDNDKWYKTGEPIFSQMVARDDYTAAAWTYVVKRCVLKVNNLYFDGRVHEDHIFTLGSYLYSKCCYTTTRILYSQRIRNGSLTESHKDADYIEQRANVLFQVLDILKKEISPNNQLTISNYVKSSLRTIYLLAINNNNPIPAIVLHKNSLLKEIKPVGLSGQLIFNFPKLFVFLYKIKKNVRIISKTFQS